jgi:hypothetical protein
MQYLLYQEKEASYLKRQAYQLSYGPDCWKMIGDSLLLEKMQGKRSLEDLVEWLFLSFVGKWDDEQVPTLMANSFQTTHHSKADMYAK